MTIQATKDTTNSKGLADVIELILDKGLVINADIAVSVAGVELLGIKVRAALASFETAAEYGLDFPSGVDTKTKSWKEARGGKETCPQCGKSVIKKELLDGGCPWCGWKSARAKQKEKGLEKEGTKDEIWA